MIYNLHHIYALIALYTTICNIFYILISLQMTDASMAFLMGILLKNTLGSSIYVIKYSEDEGRKVGRNRREENGKEKQGTIWCSRF